MSRGDEVEVMPPLLLEATELDELIAHHVGIRRQPLLHRVDRVLHHAGPVLLMQRDDLQRAVVAARQVLDDLQVILPAAVREAALLHPDLDVEERRAVACRAQQMHDDRAVHAARDEGGDAGLSDPAACDALLKGRDSLT